MPSGSNRQSRLLLRRSSSRKSASNIASECEVFLSSSRLVNLLSDLPTRKAPWEGALKKVLALWITLHAMQDDPDASPETVKVTWEKVCVLVKANYYLQTSQTLERIEMESFDDYALHAAVGLTGVRWNMLSPVIERLLRLHSSQLRVKEPVRGRLPLHVAAATPFQSDDRYEILVGLLEAYPSATVEKDNHGIYPLHLACQAKYPWKHGLEILYKAASHIGELTCECCPPELLAQQDCYEQSLDTVYSLVQTDHATLLA